MYEDENLSEADTRAKLVTPAVGHVTSGTAWQSLGNRA